MNDDFQLAPPEPLAAPGPIKAIAPAAAVGKVPITPAQQTALESQVNEVAHTLVSLPIDGADFTQAVAALSAMGSKEIVASANVSNTLLQRPVRAMQSGAFGGESDVSKQMLDLRRTVEKLDPSRQGDLFGVKKILGILPFGNKLQDYFRSYESSQGQLNAIIEALYRSKDTLLRDNAAIELEKQNMWKLMGQLEQFAFLAGKIADSVQSKIGSIETTDPERARILKEDVLFYARQKQQDIATQMAVNIQGYMALDLVKKNNTELQKGIDRATTTTVSALRTAVVVAQAIASQKLVLDQIDALNTTTGNLIAGNAKMLKENAGRVYAQASSATVDVEQLKAAFANVTSAMDDMANFKLKAIDSMQQTVHSLTTEVDKAKAYLASQRALPAGAEKSLPESTADGVARII